MHRRFPFPLQVVMLYGKCMIRMLSARDPATSTPQPRPEAAKKVVVWNGCGSVGESRARAEVVVTSGSDLIK
jgi:hypothetical protein